MSSTYRSTVQTPTRPTPGMLAAESQLLVAWLEWHRAAVLAKCRGLDAEELSSRYVEPSALSLHGMLRHMTDLELWWFQEVFAGLPDVEGYTPDDDLEAPFRPGAGLGADIDVVTTLEAFESACLASRRIFAAASSIDDVARNPSVRPTLRWVMVHMIEEYARHNGHPELLAG